MPCYRPLTAYQSETSGAVVFSEAHRHGTTRQLLLPCGQCVGCRLERSREWAARCMHEAQMHAQNSFLTLTYDPAKLTSPSLRHRDWQLFMKRLRRFLKKKKVRFYMAGEYGTQHGRPHFHSCLFGHDFEDKKHWRNMPSGARLYTSETLDRIWGQGFTSIGAVTFESAAYIARYLMDKITGPNAWQFYQHTDEETGEITDRQPEYNKMSLRPAIGKEWLTKFHSDVYPEGQVLVRGYMGAAPKYYDKLFKKEDPQAYQEMKEQREQQALLYRNDNTDARLKVKEIVARAKVDRLLRKL